MLTNPFYRCIVNICICVNMKKDNRSQEENIMVIKVLGTGCASCKKLEENAKEAVKEL